MKLVEYLFLLASKPLLFTLIFSFLSIIIYDILYTIYNKNDFKLI